MKRGSESQHGNPNLTNGGKRRLALMAAPLVLAAACSTAPNNSEATTTTTAPTTTVAPEKRDPNAPAPLSPEQLIAKENELIKAKAQVAAEDFASRIITEFNQHKSKDNFLYEPNNGSDFHAVNVLYKAPTLLSGKYGEYGLTAIVHRNAEGELDPSTVESIMLGTNDNIAGKEIGKNPGDRASIFNFSLYKNKETGDWSVQVDHATKGEMDKIYSNTGSTTTDQYNTPITADQFDHFVAQANTMFDWAVNQAPVNYIP